MNKLPLAKRVMILNGLCEGVSMRSINRMADVSINTVTKLLVDAGETCLALHDELVRGVAVKRCQADEIWSFTYAKAKNVPTAKAAPAGAGDVWTWTAMDADTKLMIAYFVGDRSGESAMILADDLRARIASDRIQITTDAHNAYLRAHRGSVRRRRRLCDHREDLPDRSGRRAWPLQPANLHGRPQAPRGRRSRPSACLDQLRRARQSLDQDAKSPLHAAHECVLEEISEPRPRVGALFRVL
jgi:IS1 family transposase